MQLVGIGIRNQRADTLESSIFDITYSIAAQVVFSSSKGPVRLKHDLAVYPCKNPRVASQARELYHRILASIIHNYITLFILFSLSNAAPPHWPPHTLDTINLILSRLFQSCSSKLPHAFVAELYMRENGKGRFFDNDRSQTCEPTRDPSWLAHFTHITATPVADQPIPLVNQKLANLLHFRPTSRCVLARPTVYIPSRYSNVPTVAVKRLSARPAQQ